MILIRAIFISVVLLMCATVSPSGPQKPKHKCPLVTVSCPTDKQLIFTATVNGEPNRAVQYCWSLTKGRIGSGQGSRTITVDESSTDGRGLTATVEAKGFPEGCMNKASCSLSSH